MTLILGLLLLLVSLSAAPQEPSSVLRGLVVGADDKGPVGNVMVQLSRTPVPLGEARDRPVRFSTRTDASGMFEFADLPPGSYRLSAAEDPTAPRQEYGTSLVGRQGMNTGTVITLAPGEKRADIVLVWKSPGIVSGRVLSNMGDSLVGMQVTVFTPARDEHGKRVFRLETAIRTDDRGYYRLAGLPPRRYYLSAGSPDVIIDFPGLAVTVTSAGKYQSVYFPGETEISKATGLEVSADAELTNVDFVLPRLSTFRVGGRIVDPLTGKPPENIPDLSLIPRDRPVLAGTEASSRPYRLDGSFEFVDVEPGSYWVSAIVPPSNIGGGFVTLRADQRPPFALTPVEVTHSDQNNVLLELTRGLSLQGAIRLREGSPSPVLELSDTPVSIQVRRIGVDGVDESKVTVTADGSGSFTLTNLLPGDYRFSVENLSSGLYVEEASFGGIDLLRNPFQLLSRTSDKVTVVLSATAGRINGSVRDNNSRPVPNVDVVLMPNIQRDRTHLFRAVKTDSSGNFVINSIPPGAYKLFAFRAVEPFAYFDSQVIEQFEERGNLVQVRESSTMTVTITGTDAVLQAR